MTGPPCPACRAPLAAYHKDCTTCGHRLTPAEIQLLRRTLEARYSWRRVPGLIATWWAGFVALFSLLMMVVGPQKAGQPVNPGESILVGLVFFMVMGAPALGGGLAALHQARQLREQLARGPRLGTAPLPQEEVADQKPTAAPNPAPTQSEQLEAEIRGLLAQLKSARRRELAWVEQELDRIRGSRSEVQQKLATLRRHQSEPVAAIQARRDALQTRLESTRDPALREVLAEQLQAVEGQLAAEESSGLWLARLEAALETSTASLRRLRAELVVLITSDSNAAATLTHSGKELEELSRDLSASREAMEEVLQVGGR
ncbi:MAG: hypothetical protein FJX77_05410 [Armatimonadetes bacterium]|nr:hypothetical protein [Armatimonadota bacterium]